MARNDVYEQRQIDKELRVKYREKAKLHYTTEYISIPEHANVAPVEDGAFVEAIIWIPRSAL